MNLRRDFLAAVPCVVFSLLLLNGCTSAHQDEEIPVPTYDEAQTELEGLLKPIQDELAGEWEYSDSGANPCSLDGSEGAQSAAQRSGPGVDTAEQRALVDAVVARWTEAGFPPEVVELAPVNDIVVTEVKYPSDGSDENGMSLLFGTATTATVIGGQTRCGTGNATQINDEYWEQRGE